MTRAAGPARRGVVRREAEEGAATVISVALCGLIVVVTLLVVGVTGLVATHRRAQAAADLAALAGATAAQEGRDACGRARHVALLNRARLARCETVHGDVVVEVVSEAPKALGSDYAMRARARAGPVLR